MCARSRAADGMGLIAVVALCLEAGAAGCTPPKVARASGQQLYARASFELNCHPALLRFVSLGEGVRGVAGCGNRLVYIERCQLLGDTRQCMWVSNSVAPATGSPTAPAAAPIPTAAGVATSTGSPPAHDVLQERK